MTGLNHPIIYADGMSKISHENGVVKIDFVTLQDHYSGPGTKVQKVPTTTATMVLSPAGFQQALKTMQDMAASLDKEIAAAAKKAAPTVAAE